MISEGEFPEYARARTWESAKVTKANQPVIDRLKQWPEGRPLYLHGEPGRGKTYLVQCQCVSLDTPWLRYFFEPDMFRWINAGIGQEKHGGIGFDQRRRVLETKNTPLVIDDMGSSRITESRYEVLFALLNSRLECGLPTLITSNYAPMDLGAMMSIAEDTTRGHKLIGRIIQFCDVIELKGKDWRQDKCVRSLPRPDIDPEAKPAPVLRAGITQDVARFKRLREKGKDWRTDEYGLKRFGPTPEEVAYIEKEMGEEDQ